MDSFLLQGKASEICSHGRNVVLGGRGQNSIGLIQQHENSATLRFSLIKVLSMFQK